MSKKVINTQVMQGFMELSPIQQRVFDSMLATIRTAYERFGFIGIETPILEREEVLLAKAGGDTEKQIYRFVKGDNKIAMRFDHTVPLARYVVEHMSDLTFPFRRHAIGKVYRGERPQKGRYREFYQADIDVIGRGQLPLSFDAEIPSVIYQIFKELDLGPFLISVNNRKILNGFFVDLGIQDSIVEILREIDKLEKVGAQAVRQSLVDLGITPETVDQILSFIGLNGSTDEILGGLQNLRVTNSDYLKGLEELTEVVKLMRAFGIPDSHFAVNLTIARGLDYYTGTVYETKLTQHPEIGSVCSGGRYDNLAETFTNESLPGVGISIGVTRLFSQLWALGLLKPMASSPSIVLVAPMTDDLSNAISIVADIRNADIPAEVYFNGGGLRKSLGYANQLGIPYVIIIGEDEIASGKITLKRMSDGSQSVYSSIEEVLETIRS